ncbi:hypothetical protein Dcae01_00176 [Deinococcus caeni]|uniref:SAF domain-containing protein n=1 Tax=Deinococcus caeni TaxID=569127 RepID=A0ABP9UCG8_9DEIO
MRAAALAGALRGVLLVGLLGLGAAQATAAPTLSLEQQARKAEVIVRATLGPPAEVRDGDVTYVAYPLTVTETIAGDPASLPRQGGAPALLFLKGLADLPDLRAGQDVIALLYSARLDSPLVGFNQGLYPVVNGSLVPGVTLAAAPAAPSAPGTPPTSAATPTAATSPAATTPPSPIPAATTPPPATVVTDPARLRAAILAAREARP